ADSVDFSDLAADTAEFSGAQLASLATEAGMFAIRDDRDEVHRQDFDDAYEKLVAEGDTESSGPRYPSYIQ
ncbi:26S protease regulatory subunit, partial [Halobacterium salinarum]|nr:26S protease regulatory subunit [Halobacterium salinarum]